MSTSLIRILVSITLCLFMTRHGNAQLESQAEEFSRVFQVHQHDSIYSTHAKIDGSDFYQHRRYHNPDSALPHEVRVIIEFKGDPLAKVLQRDLSLEEKKSTVANKQREYDILFASLKRDVKQMNKNNRSSDKSAKPEFEQKYTKLILGQRLIIDRSQIEFIKALPYVKNVHIDRVVKTNLNESVPQINADSVWHEFENEGDSVRVGIIDTGIDYMHPDLGGGFGPGFKVIGGYDFVNGDEDPMDDADHGTHVAGTVAADGTLKGVAPKALLYALKVLDNNGSGWSSDIILAIEWAADPDGDFDFSDHLDVINMSLGGDPQEEDPLVEAVEAASAIGVVSCISAGNSGYMGEGSIGSPGVSPSAITVGAVDKNDTIANFSSIGPTSLTFMLKPDIVAPGVDINSTLPGAEYEHFNGTSMASPHIAGVCALLKRQHPDWSPQELKSAIMLSAKDLGLAKNIQGSGRVDAYEAISIETMVNKPSLQFGMDTLPSDSFWIASDTINIRNITDTIQLFSLEAADVGVGVSVSFSESTFSLAPSADTIIVIFISVDNSLLDAQENVSSTTYTGHINLSNNSQSYTLPWMFLRGFMVNFSQYELLDMVFIFNEDYFWEGDPFWDDGLDKKLFLPGRYFMIAELYTGERWGHKQTSIVKEIDIDSSTTIVFDRAEATNRIIFDTEDELGQSYSAVLDKMRSVAIMLDDSMLYCLNRYTENYTGSAGWQTISYSIGDIKYIGTESTGQYNNEADFRKMDTLYITDLPPGAKIYIAEQRKHKEDTWDICFSTSEPIDGISGDIVFSKRSSSYQSLTINDLSPLKHHKWYPKIYWNTSRFWDWVFSFGSDDETNIPQFTLHMPPEGEIDEDFHLYYTCQREFDFYTNPLRLISDTFYFGEGQVPGALGIAAGDTIIQGNGAWLSGINSYTSSRGRYLTPYFKGSLNEQGISDKSICMLFDDQGMKVDSARELISIEQDPGRYNLQVKHSIQQSLYGLPIINTLDIWLNIGGEDEEPPTLNLFYLKDFKGKKADIINKNDSVTLVFALADGNQAFPDSTWFGPVVSDSTKAYAKHHYAEEWVPVELNSIGYSTKVGLIYSGVFKTTNYDTAHFDIKIQSVDDAGNSNETILSPALFIKNHQPPTAVDDAYELNENKTFYSKQEITENDINPFAKPEALKVEIISETTNGELILSTNNHNFHYIPNADFSGTDVFTYRVHNEKYTSNTATVTLTIQPDALPEKMNASDATIRIYPNPVTDELNIDFVIATADKINIDIYDITGQKIANVFNGELGAGEHEVFWNTESSAGVSLQSGIYLLQFEGESINELRKVIIQ